MLTAKDRPWNCQNYTTQALIKTNSTSSQVQQRSLWFHSEQKQNHRGRALRESIWDCALHKLIRVVRGRCVLQVSGEQQDSCWSVAGRQSAGDVSDRKWEQNAKRKTKIQLTHLLSLFLSLPPCGVQCDIKINSKKRTVGIGKIQQDQELHFPLLFFVGGQKLSVVHEEIQVAFNDAFRILPTKMVETKSYVCDS